MASRQLRDLSVDVRREVLLDLGDAARFNGWPDSETPGGHVPGALRVDAGWLAELEGLTRARRLLNGRRALLFGDDAAVEVAVGHLPDAERVHGAWSDWRGPRVSLPAKELLMPARVVAAQIDDFDIVEACDAEDRDPDAAHILGARRLDTIALEGPPDWNAKPVAALRETLAQIGLTGRPVVVYGRDPMAAARCGLILIHAGLPDVRLLDGSWVGWVAQHRVVETGWQQVRTAEVGDADGASPFATFDEVRKLMDDGAPDRLVSIRSLAEHRGEVSGYDWIAERGDLPGARWGHAGDPASFAAAFRYPDGTASPFEVELHWEGEGIDAALQPVFYCGTGWRAAEAWFIATALGWRARVYDGGWLEWSARDAGR